MASPEWQDRLLGLKERAPKEIDRAASLEELEAVRHRLLGRDKGELTDLLKGLKDLSAGDKRVFGSIANQLKAELEAKLEDRAASFRRSDLETALGAVRADLSLPGAPFPSGHLHPLTRTLRRMEEILGRLGFNAAEGPHVETDWFNFEALNIPAEHPARDLQDTFYARLPLAPEQYIAGPHPPESAGAAPVMRTHTSPVQIRSMLKQAKKGLPLRIMSPGRVFRNEAVDATHSAVFHQMEGLYVDREVSLANLKGTLELFIKGLFGAEARMRFIPSYFPFVEPGVQVDVSCVFCGGRGRPDCAVCKGSGYLEMLGAGLVHPKVLRHGGYDPREWSGYAFGIGVERVAMLLFGVSDIRSFYENDLRFLEQF